MFTLGRSFPNAPFSDSKQALEYLNRAHWNLKITSHDGKHDLWSGDGELHLLTSTSEDNVWAFILGMGLTYLMVGPDDMPGFGQPDSSAATGPE